MIDKRITAIPVFKKENGETITAVEATTKAIEVYNKYNFLNSLDVDVIDTGKYADTTGTGIQYYVNYCGWFLEPETPEASGVLTKQDTTIEIPLANINSDITELLNKI